MHQTSIEKDPMRELLEFPNDDIEVRLLSKQCRTIAPIIPEHGLVYLSQSNQIDISIKVL